MTRLTASKVHRSSGLLRVYDDTDTFSGDAHITVFWLFDDERSASLCLSSRTHSHNASPRSHNEAACSPVAAKSNIVWCLTGVARNATARREERCKYIEARQVRLQCMHGDCKGGLFWPGSLRIGLRSSTVAMALPTESKAQVVE